MRQVYASGPPAGGDRRDAHPDGRDRHRQRRVRAPAFTSASPRAARAVRGVRLRRRPAQPGRKRAVRPRARLLHGRARRAPGRLRARAGAARCSSTRSASCRSSCSRGCCACSTITRCAGSAAPRSGGSTSASSRRRTAISRRAGRRPSSSARTSTSVWPPRSFSSRRCAIASTICPCWCRACCGISAATTCRFRRATLEALRAHSWPGNVRELKNVLACALAFVEARHASSRIICGSSSPPSEDAGLERLQLGGHSLVRLERAAIRQTLQQVRGNKVHAAKVLGIAPSTLYEKVKKYGL